MCVYVLVCIHTYVCEEISAKAVVTLFFARLNDAFTASLAVVKLQLMCVLVEKFRMC